MRSPDIDRAQKESNLLAAKLSWMRAETIIWAWICLSWRMEVHRSAKAERREDGGGGLFGGGSGRAADVSTGFTGNRARDVR